MIVHEKTIAERSSNAVIHDFFLGHFIQQHYFSETVLLSLFLYR